MKPYRFLLFDLFSTVALWRPERVPRLVVGGQERPSTLGVLLGYLADDYPNIDLEAFYAAMTTANNEIAETHKSGREVASRARFKRILVLLGLSDDTRTGELAETLSLAHMQILGNATSVPQGHLQTLAQLQQKFRLALVSNFDHAPTARTILERDGAGQYFEHMLISDHHGWRKPHRRIFDDTLALLGAAAEESLFIGDSVDDDIVGAAAAGIDVVWVNKNGLDLPASAPAPLAEIKAITELEQLLL